MCTCSMNPSRAVMTIKPEKAGCMAGLATCCTGDQHRDGHSYVLGRSLYLGDLQRRGVCLGNLARLPSCGALQGFNCTRFVEMQDYIELITKLGMKVVAYAF